jgi:hypothetical protein
MPAKLIAALLLVVPMWLLLPLDRQIHADRQQLKYGGLRVTRAIRDRVGQEGAIALLAGFRGIVADFIWIQGHSRWEKKQWLQQYNDMQMVVFLQPQSTLFWDVGAWHMAYNIGYAERVDTNNYTVAQGLKRERVWHDRARDFLKRGIENIPHRYDLYFKLGWLYWHKYKDAASAAREFQRAAQFPEAPSYVGRMYARAVEQAGDVGAAYEYWRRLWFQDHEKSQQLWPVVEREVRRLEEQLQVPAEQRVFPKPVPIPVNPTP